MESINVNPIPLPSTLALQVHMDYLRKKNINIILDDTSSNESLATPNSEP